MYACLWIVPWFICSLFCRGTASGGGSSVRETQDAVSGLCPSSSPTPTDWQETGKYFSRNILQSEHHSVAYSTNVCHFSWQPKEITWCPSRVFPQVRACMFSSRLTSVTFLADPSAGGGLPRGTFIYATSPIPVQVRRRYIYCIDLRLCLFGVSTQ